jgi:pimeloyl-[acyl-carrier protein] methyl ester esterase
MVAIVLLPGMDGTGKMFAEFSSGLGERFRPIVVSYPEDQPLGYGELEARVRVVLPKDEPFVLLAESFSGPIAISLAASKPSGLIGLILCCTFARNPLPLLGPFKSIVNVLPLTSRFADLGAPLMFGRFSTPKLKGALRQALSRVPVTTLRARLLAVLEVDVSENMREIEVPILYLQASLDRIVPKSAARHLQSQSSRAKIQTLEGPHLLLQAMPLEAGRMVKEFTTKVAAAFNSSLHTDALRQ